MNRTVSRIFVLGLTFTFGLVPLALHAQYFGRNKVKYETFHFEVMHTPHFNVHFYPEETRAAFDGARMAERWYTRHSNVFHHTFAVKKPILFYADQPDFQQTNAISEMLSEGTGGVTEPLKDRVVLPFTGILGDDDHVIGHELVHAFQFDIVSSGGRSSLNAMQRLPLWIVEGMAEYFSLGHLDPHTAMWLRDAVLFDDIPTVKDLEVNPRYFPYRFGQALLGYIGGRWGDDMIPRLFRAALAVGSRAAIDSLLHMSADTLSHQWARELKRTYAPLIAGKQKPREAGHTLLAKDLHGSSTNLAPAISPDGRYLAVMSEHDIFSIDLWLADARTGKFLKKLSSSERNFHFDAISFVSSSGTWSPDSRRFATVVYAKGNNELAIFDVRRRKIVLQRGFKGIGAMSSPAWSPNGRYIAFSGQKGGISDLYLWDLVADSLIQLTDDRYGQIQPAWSPDGLTLAFVTDEGPATDLGRLSHNGLQIGFLNLETGTSKILEIFPVGKHINPQFSPDGSSLYFIADPDGFSNIYRLDLNTGQVYKITDVATGISGLSSHSPALSVAARTGQLAFSVFEHRDYIVNTLGPTEAVGVPVSTNVGGLNVAGIIAPAEAVETSVVDRQIWDFDTGLPLVSNFPVTPYRTRLTLDYVGGQTFLGLASSRYGSLIGGGLALYYSDMLGNYVLGVALQANGTFQDIGGEVFYLNRKSRWNWGVDLSHTPYASTYQDVETVPVQVGNKIYAGTGIATVTEHVFVDEARAVLYYPLSITQRWEFDGGLTRLWYRAEEEAYVVLGEQVVDHEKRKLPAPSGITQGQFAAAFVGDWSYFGFTSPTRGGRYRFELQPNFGAARYLAALADYRRYSFHRPFTFAFRFLHYGRYGRDAESDMLSPLFLGYETFVRGYSSGSFSYSECSVDPKNPQACPEFDRLVGSRLAVVNAEFRIPLFGNENFGLVNFPYLPTELSLFLDGGVAWSRGAPPRFKFARRSRERIPVFSTGVSARVNVMGYAVVELYYAYPFQRPEKGWTFGFQVAPGW